MVKQRLTLTILFMLAVGSIGCTAENKSYCNSLCAMCGCSLHSKTNDGKTTTDIKRNELSKWLSSRIPKNCKHQWIPVSGWSSENNLCWDGSSNWHKALSSIRKLHSDNEIKKTEERLNQYFSILRMDDKKTQNTKLTNFLKVLNTKRNKLK